jgi:phosphoserine phosphatase RsbU/P
MAAPASKPGPVPQTRPIEVRHGTVKRFWDRVTEGLELTQLWDQFKTEAQTGYRLYSREIKVDEQTFATRRQHVKYVLKSFFWAIMTKLSPAPRVLLLIAVTLLVTGFEFTYNNFAIGSGGTRFIAGLMLLGLLLMEVADRVTLKRDLQIAREIQLWLVPEKAPEIAGMEVAFYNRPANTVAGDYYDVFHRAGCEGPDAPVLLAVADVAGKSLPAALLMATFQASLHTLSIETGSLLNLTQGLNRYACEHSRGGQRFTTAFLADYDPGTGAISYINAGHNAPMLLRGNGGAIERLDRGGLPLGIVPLAEYEVGSVSLQPGDTLFVFTDGLVEAANGAGQEYGDERVIASAGANRHQNAAAMLNGVVRALDAFVGTTPQHDDITCLLAKRAS